MNIKHNTRCSVGLALGQLVAGELYLRVDVRPDRPMVYLAVASRPGPTPATDLVNMKTGCLVGRVCADARFKHLPDATLDTGA